jgi:hypothetical protein
MQHWVAVCIVYGLLFLRERRITFNEWPLGPMVVGLFPPGPETFLSDL